MFSTQICVVRIQRVKGPGHVQISAISLQIKIVDNLRNTQKEPTGFELGFVFVCVCFFYVKETLGTEEYLLCYWDIREIY